MNQEQFNYDARTMMPIISDMVAKESENIKQMSNKLVDIGETTLAVSLLATEMQKQTDKNETHLVQILQNQDNVIQTLQGVTNELNHNQVDSETVERLKVEFANKLETVLDIHGADKDAILNRIGEVYGEYTNKVSDLSNSIHKLNDTLSNPSYQERVNKLTTEVSQVKNTLKTLTESQEEISRKQQQRIDGLLNQLSDVYAKFSTLIKATDDSRDTITNVVQYMHIIEDRLDALLAINTNTLDNKDGGE